MSNLFKVNRGLKTKSLEVFSGAQPDILKGKESSSKL